MSRHDDLDLRFLWALTKINKSLAHGVNGHLGNLTLQLTLAKELLKRAQIDPEAQANIDLRLGKAADAATDLTAAVDRALSGTRPAKHDEGSLDLRRSVRKVEALLLTYHKDAQTFIRVTVPTEPVALEGSPDVIQRALLVTLLEASLTLNVGDTLELSLDGDGVLEVKGPPAHRWLPKVADIIEEIGGGLNASPNGSSVAIRLPIQTTNSLGEP